ncbi:MAG: NAD(P)-dependent glycerol-3-phosphate dehydrogenase [Lachnospiraceae bacterium]|nr:NAD(P)-dependent glycerol-3-phosphate dehydrogenase [Lachnospiraceae bacterium]
MTDKMKQYNAKVTVIGAGHWGMALADVLAFNNSSVTVCARRMEEVNLINNEHKSSYFDNYIFPDNLVATKDVEKSVAESEYIVISTPTKTVTEMLDMFRKFPEKKYIFACKGLINGKMISTYVEDECKMPLKLAVLSGPSFANELILKKSTAVVIAACDIELAREFQELFHTDFFRPYASSDILGVEVCGAVKNVYAIAAGFLDREYKSFNMKSAMLTRALAEMTKVMQILNAKSETLMGLAGLGDLMLTCHSDLSRNYRYGYNYVDNKQAKETTEGINATLEMRSFATTNGIELPIVEGIYKVIYEGLSLEDVIESLMRRTLKDE